MNRSTAGFIFASLIGTAPLVPSLAHAQSTDMNAVEREVSSDLGMMGISGVDVKILTLQQLQEIKLVESMNGSDSEKKMKVVKIIGPNAKIN